MGGRPAAADEPALLRVAHLSPDTPAVDAAVTRVPDGALLSTAPGLGYGAVSPYQRLPAGRYAVAVRAVGTGPATPALLSVAVDLAPGDARTVVLDDRFADVRLETLADDLTPPPAGQARVRVLAAAASAPDLDLSLAEGPALARGLRFPGAGAWVVVPGGVRTLRASSAGPAADIPLLLSPGEVVSLLVLDAPGGGVTVRPVVDAAGPAVVPAGPVDAGHGGTARGALPATASTTLLTAGLLGGAPRPAPPRDSRPVEAAPRSPAGGPPVRLLAPDAGIDAPLVPITPDRTGALTAPEDLATAGWLTSGPPPGSPGPAVVAGHVDGAAGPAVFFALSRLGTGEEVVVVRADGERLRFVVDRVEEYPKEAFPTAQVYGPTPDPQLRLITCGGRFDPAAGSYADNVVVYARLAG